MVYVRRKQHGKGGLRRYMAQAMAAVSGQFVVRPIGRGRAVEIHREDGCIRTGNRKVTCAQFARAMKQ